MKGRKPAEIIAGKMKDVPPPPAWLSRHGKAEWRRVAPILVERGVLTEADLGTLAAYADAMGQLVDATALVNREGMVLETPKGPRKHQAISIQINARNQVRQLAAELGLTPVSRSRPTFREGADEDLSFLD